MDTALLAVDPVLRTTLLSRPVVGRGTVAHTRLLCAVRRFEIWTATCTVKQCSVCSEQHIVGGVGAGHGVGQVHNWEFGDGPDSCKRCTRDEKEKRVCFSEDAGL